MQRYPPVRARLLTWGCRTGRKRLSCWSRCALLFFILLSLLTLAIPVSVVKATSVVTYPDSKLEAAIRDAIGIPTGDIYDDNLTSLVGLYADGLGIVDLTGLEYCTNLMYLDLSRNHISDISSLSGLSKLTYIDLHDNQISDIKPLVNNSGISSGDVVDLSGDPLSSTSADTHIPALQNRGVTVYWEAPINQPPDQPVNISPTDSGISLTPTLQSSTFADPDLGDSHAASQWQVTVSGRDYSITEFDSGTDSAHLTAITLGPLSYSTTYYWHVRYQDSHGAWSDWSTDTSFTTTDIPDATDPSADTTAPTTPVVTDDGATTTSTSQIHASWTCSDPDSGITEYDYAIGTTAGETDVVEWTSAGSNTQVTQTGLALSAGKTYYFAVMANNGAGLWSEIGVSDGITVARGPKQDDKVAGLPIWVWIVIGLGAPVLGVVAYRAVRAAVMLTRAADTEYLNDDTDDDPTE